MKIKQILSILILMAAVMAMPAMAIQCGDTVTGNVVLTSDLVCNAAHGLAVGASNTTIDLNGFTISCVDAGYAGSCQKTNTYSPAIGFIGIRSNAFDNVTIKGPGTIYGFNLGIFLHYGKRVRIQNVTVTGPAVPNATANTKGPSAGIVVAETACPAASKNLDQWAEVSGNTISNHAMGLQLGAAQCVSVRNNIIARNQGANGDSHGIDLINASQNLISNNTVVNNGNNTFFDSGIQLLLPGTVNNVVASNTVSNNCGDGIVTRKGAANNNIAANSIHYNSPGTVDGHCAAVSANTYFDLTTDSMSLANTYNANNVCKTQSIGIPVGVCNPTE